MPLLYKNETVKEVQMCCCVSSNTSSFPSAMVWAMLAEAMVHAGCIFASFWTWAAGDINTRGVWNGMWTTH
jgi:hypothetical protein